MNTVTNGTTGVLKKMFVVLVENAPATIILLYLIVRQDEFVRYLVEQCVIHIPH